MKIASHLMVSRHGVYYLRFVIPYRLRPLFQGQCEIRKSLKTRNPRHAKLAVKSFAFTIEKLFFDINSYLQGDQGMGTDKAFFETNITVTPDGNIHIETKTDPNNPDDHKHASSYAKEIMKVFRETPSSVPSVWFDSEESPLISVVAEKYFLVNGEKWKPKTFQDYQSILKNFIDYCGDPQVHTITSETISEYKVFLKSPREGERPIMNRRLDFCLGVLNGFFKYASASGYYKRSVLPTEKQSSESSSARKKKPGYKHFSDEDLAAIFDRVNLGALKKPHEFWMPILGLFTGARINELAQLGIGDIYKAEDIDVIRITDEGDDAKSVKTVNSIRVIPLHKAVLEMGFLDYLDDVRKLGEMGCRVFPYLGYHAANGYGHLPSKGFRRYLDKLGLYEKNKVFHSFRKTMNDRLKQLGVPEETRCQITGHAYESTNSTIYSRPHDIPYLKNVVDKLYFETVDTSKIRYQPGQFMAILKSEMARRQRQINSKAARQRRGK